MHDVPSAEHFSEWRDNHTWFKVSPLLMVLVHADSVCVLFLLSLKKINITFSEIFRMKQEHFFDLKSGLRGILNPWIITSQLT